MTEQEKHIAFIASKFEEFDKAMESAKVAGFGFKLEVSYTFNSKVVLYDHVAEELDLQKTCLHQPDFKVIDDIDYQQFGAI